MTSHRQKWQTKVGDENKSKSLDPIQRSRLAARLNLSDTANKDWQILPKRLSQIDAKIDKNSPQYSADFAITWEYNLSHNILSYQIANSQSRILAPFSQFRVCVCLKKIHLFLFRFFSSVDLIFSFSMKASFFSIISVFLLLCSSRPNIFFLRIISSFSFPVFPLLRRTSPNIFFLYLLCSTPPQLSMLQKL